MRENLNLKDLLENLEAMNYSRKVLHRREIAVVDDDINQYELIRHIIEKSRYKENFNICAYFDPKTAMQNLLENEFDLLIIDINLPNSLGFTFGSVVRDIIPLDTPIIYISSDRNNLKKYNRIKHKNSIFLLKPFDYASLIDSIESFHMQI